jgi:hypothetical protein
LGPTDLYGDTDATRFSSEIGVRDLAEDRLKVHWVAERVGVKESRFLIETDLREFPPEWL